MLIFFLLFFQLFSISISQKEIIFGTVFFVQNRFVFKNIIDPLNGLCWGVYEKKPAKEGVHHMFITSINGTKRDPFLDFKIAYACGYLEGRFSEKEVRNSLINYEFSEWTNRNLSGMPDYVSKFFRDQFEFMKSLYENDPRDEFNINVEIQRQQIMGLLEGINYNVNEKERISYERLNVLLSSGDLINIAEIPHQDTKKTKFMRRKKFDVNGIKEKEPIRHTHCSLAFRKSTINKDIFVTHNTWFYYTSMDRIVKDYNINFGFASAKRLFFLGYPGCLASNDDFITTSNNLIITETTNEILDSSVFSLITPKSLLTWQRANIASRIANSASEWVEIFAKHHSGTYSNCYFALDMKKVTKTEEDINLESNGFWLIEEMPSLILKKEITEEFNKKGYLGSYNIPYFKEMRDATGITAYLEKYPEEKVEYDYFECARSKIIQRDLPKVDDLLGMKKFIRSNDYLNDPLQFGSPYYAISSRCDLLPESTLSLNEPGEDFCFGATDAKLLSVNEWKEDQAFHAVIGPTHEFSSYMKPFEWKSSKYCKNTPHFGLEENFSDSEWVKYIPKKLY